MFVGADVEEIERLAASVRSGATALDQIAAMLMAVRVGSIWPGERGAAVGLDLRRTGSESAALGARCRELAGELDRQAAQQREAAMSGAAQQREAAMSEVAMGEGSRADEAAPSAASPAAASPTAPPAAPPAAPQVPAWARTGGDLAPKASIDRNPPILRLIAAALKAPNPGSRERVEVLTGLVEGRWTGASPIDQHVVVFDPRERGLVAVAHGDLASASRVSVYVPGTGADLDSAARDLDRGLALATAARRISPGAVVITWIGYRSPEVIAPVSGWRVTPWDDAAVSRARAVDGAAALATFVRRLDLGEHVELSLIGHSYGSLVVAGAASELGGVDDLVLVGSPGVGVTRASDLSAEAVYSLAAANDAIAAVPVFGETPDSMSFGATRVDVGEVGPGGAAQGSAYGSTPGSALRSTLRSTLGSAIGGHGGYFEPGSRSLQQLALIAAGQGESVSEAPFDWSGWAADAARRSLAAGVVGAPAMALPDPLEALRSQASPGSRLASIVEGLSAARAVADGGLELAAEWALEEMVDGFTG